ncbi:MAG: glycosyltransferase family 39 protein [Pseudomonadota bacterium]
MCSADGETGTRKSFIAATIKFFSSWRGMHFFILAFVMAVAFSFIFPQKIEYDSTQYEHLGWNISQGNGLSDASAAPFVPTSGREPVYPLFISLFYLFFGRHPEIVLVAQSLLHATTALLIYRLACRWFSLSVAGLAGFLTAVDPTLYGFCSYLLTEPLALFLLASFVYLAVFVRERNGLAFSLAGGALLGALALCRAVFMFLPVVFFVFMVFSRFPSKLGKRIVYGMILILVFMSVLSPWLYRNKKAFGVAFITARSGEMLLWKALRTEHSPREMLVDLVYGTSDTLGRKLFPDDYSRMNISGEHGPENVYPIGVERYMRYLADGYSELEADRLLRIDAIRIIIKRPFKYIAQCFVDAWKLSFFEIVPFAYSTRFNQLMQRGDCLLGLGTALRILLRYVYSWLIILLAVKGFLEVQKEWRRKCLLLVPIIYTIGTAIPFDVSGRYVYPALPFILILASVSVVNFIERKQPSL